MSCYNELIQVVNEKLKKLPKGMAVNSKSLARYETACNAIDSLSEDNRSNYYGIKVCESGDFDVAVMFSSFSLNVSGGDEERGRFLQVLRVAKKVEFSTMEDDSACVKVIFGNLFMT